jgi:hypothetical protein
MSVLRDSAVDLSLPTPISGRVRAAGGESLRLVAEPLDLVEAAIDVLAVRHQVSREEAVDLLHRAAGEPGRPLEEVARDVVLIGLPALSAQTQIELRPAPGPGSGRPGGMSTQVGAGGEPGSSRFEVALAEKIAAVLLERLVDVSALPDVLAVISAVAVELVPGCDAAGVALLREGAPVEVASVQEGVRGVDEAQYGDSDGPYLRAVQRQRLVRIDDLGFGPVGSWARAALEAGFRGVLALPVVTGADTTATVSLYTRCCDGWTRPSLAAAEALAVQAGRALTLVQSLTSGR